MGRCPSCGAWGSMAEEERPSSASSSGSRAVAVSTRPALPIAQIPMDGDRRTATGIGELDRVLGGGIVAGSVTLVGGEPGAGKSTLLLQAANGLAERGALVLYVSAEESPAQVRMRAERLGALNERVLLAAEVEIPAILSLMDQHKPAVLILDSIQTVTDPDTAGTAGGVSQVRACAGAIVRACKDSAIAGVLVGHVTKEGQLAGPRTLEHLVDTVCELSGDRHHALRLLQAVKNRYGAVGEVGCFTMTGEGMIGVDEAGRLFVGEAPDGTTGVAVTLALEGRRPLACEVQALTIATPVPNPRRVASGLDHGRLALLLAVLEARTFVKLSTYEVFVSTVGGVRLNEPAVDLALCLAIASSRNELAVPRRWVVMGEVGLAGELRLVAQTERRLQEAARLGFRGAILPGAYDGEDFGLRLHKVADLAGALRAGLGGQ